jgi:hypothetical protein
MSLLTPSSYSLAYTWGVLLLLSGAPPSYYLAHLCGFSYITGWRGCGGLLV